MGKYASGYVLTAAMSVLGAIVIVVSIIGGLVVMSNAPRGEEGLGWVLIIAGSVQGFLLIGIGAIGTAILDGSVAQQDLLSNQISTGAVKSHKQDDSKVEYLLRLILGNSLGKPGMAFQEQFLGISIFKSDAGIFFANDAAFDSLELARGSLAKEKIPSSTSAEEFEDFAIVGAYKIPRVNGRYLVNGMEFDSIKNLKNEIERIVKKGYPFQLNKYLV
jgi:hypothetical protein